MAKAAEVESGRYALILKRDDGKEEVTDIKIMEGGVEPEVYNKAVESGNYAIEEVSGGVQIGMVRGGEIGADGGFGFEDEATAGGRYGPGVTRTTDTEGTTVAIKTEGKARGLSRPKNEAETNSTSAADDSANAKRSHSGASKKSS